MRTTFSTGGGDGFGDEGILVGVLFVGDAGSFAGCVSFSTLGSGFGSILGLFLLLEYA